jgi:uncharacterized protein (DUF362 family)
MDTKFTRRNFLKKSSLFGLTTFVGANLFSASVFSKDFLQNVDIGVVQSSDYFNATIKAIELIGGIKKFVQTGNTIGILTNSQSTNPGTFTNPDIALAIIKLCLDAGASEIYSLDNAPETYWKRAGSAGSNAGLISKIQKSSGSIAVPINKSVSLKEAEVAVELLEIDVFINISIVKHHKGLNYSGTLKNLTGICSPAQQKSIQENPDLEIVSQSIADLNLIRKSNLSVVDATEFITTNGPDGPGEIKKLQKVIAGSDTVAVDAYCSTLLGLNPESISMIKKAGDQGIGNINFKSMAIKEITI